MKRLLLGTIVVILLVAAVASLAVRLRERSGSDIGLNRGDGRRCWEFVNAADVVRAPFPALTYPGPTGSPVGGEIGFRWQIANSVFGIAMNGTAPVPRALTLNPFCRAFRMNAKLLPVAPLRTHSVTPGMTSSCTQQALLRSSSINIRPATLRLSCRSSTAARANRAVQQAWT
jgi:outer membrane immunogenic protein